jgi:nicotinate-nucleotide pyrophosphorylase (carboxylating)
VDLESLVSAALNEDLPSGDITTDALHLGLQVGRARLIAKEDLVVSGVEPFNAVLKKVNPAIEILWQFEPGAFVWRGQTLATIKGPLADLLKAERTALNFMGHLCGIATLTRCFVEQVEHTGCVILDTRKTLPGWRQLEKTAVRHGGGRNHRSSLSEKVLLKDNHLQAVGGVRAAVERVRAQTKEPIEVECDNLADIETAVALKVHWILLDNFSDEDLKKAVSLIPKSIKKEASGNMSLERVKKVAEMGVDAISVGALTHSAPAADVSLEFEA